MNISSLINKLNSDINNSLSPQKVFTLIDEYCNDYLDIIQTRLALLYISGEDIEEEIIFSILDIPISINNISGVYITNSQFEELVYKLFPYIKENDIIEYINRFLSEIGNRKIGYKEFVDILKKYNKSKELISEDIVKIYMYLKSNNKMDYIDFGEIIDKII